jgi:hypothetical protein
LKVPVPGGHGQARWRRLLEAAGVLAIAASLAASLGSGSAGADGVASIQALIADDGTGQMIVNSQSNPPGETWAWEKCSVDLATCLAFGTGREQSTADAEAEVVFRARSSLGAVAVSPVWHGPLQSKTPPSVSGSINANALVTPEPGQWQGGWEGDTHYAQLAACRDPAGTDCITLTDLHYGQGCPNGAAVLDEALVGRYLRVADRDLGPDPVFAADAVALP